VYITQVLIRHLTLIGCLIDDMGIGIVHN